MKKRLLSSNYYNKSIENGIEHIYVQSFPTLYKYQSSTEYSLHNFEADEIWGTVPSSFNDPYDCAVCFTTSKLITSVMSHLTEQRLKNYAILLGKSSKKEISKNDQKYI